MVNCTRSIIVETIEDVYLVKVVGLEGVASHLIRGVSNHMADADLVNQGCRAMWSLSANNGESHLCCCDL